MVEYGLNYPVLILVTGLVIVLIMLVKSGLERAGVPSLLGYLLLGFLLCVADKHWGLLGRGTEEIFGFLARIGLITLLFRVGLESNLEGLLKQLPRASLIWFGDVGLSGILGFVTAYYVLQMNWITALIVAVAFTATSVGISVAVWEDAGALGSPNGELLIDVAELDDISAVVLMAMLFSVLPALRSQGGSVDAAIPFILGGFVIKLLLFGAGCLLFSRFVERYIIAYFENLSSPPDPMLVIVAIGFVIAALADFLGFSLAIGAFFAGLVFSRDPEAVKMEGSFLPLYELFSPFFFVGIGLDIAPQHLTTALGMGLVLLVAAVLGKILATGIPVFLMSGLTSASLIGVSMVPRAEISMVVMQRALNLGEWAVPREVFGAMIVVSMATCMASPLAVRSLLKKWPQEEGEPR